MLRHWPFENRVWGLKRRMTHQSRWVNVHSFLARFNHVMKWWGPMSAQLVLSECLVIVIGCSLITYSRDWAEISTVLSTQAAFSPYPKEHIVPQYYLFCVLLLDGFYNPFLEVLHPLIPLFHNFLMELKFHSYFVQFQEIKDDFHQGFSIFSTHYFPKSISRTISLDREISSMLPATDNPTRGSFLPGLGAPINLTVLYLTQSLALIGWQSSVSRHGCRWVLRRALVGNRPTSLRRCSEGRPGWGGRHREGRRSSGDDGGMRRCCTPAMVEGRAWNHISAKVVEDIDQDAGIGRLVKLGGWNAFGSSSATRCHLQVDALHVSLCTIVAHCVMQCDDLMSKDIVSCCDIGGDVDRPGIVGSHKLTAGPPSGGLAAVEKTSLFNFEKLKLRLVHRSAASIAVRKIANDLRYVSVLIRFNHFCLGCCPILWSLTGPRWSSNHLLQCSVTLPPAATSPARAPGLASWWQIIFGWL